MRRDVAAGGGQAYGDRISEFVESEAWTASSPDHEKWQQLVDHEIAVATTNAECEESVAGVRDDVEAELRARMVEAFAAADWSVPLAPIDGPGPGSATTGGEPAAPPTDTAATETAPEPLDLTDPTNP